MASETLSYKVDFIDRGAGAIVEMRGTLEKASKESVQTLVQSLRERQISQILLDLSNIKFCSSEGFFLIQRIQKNFEKLVVLFSSRHELIYRTILGPLEDIRLTGNPEEAIECMEDK